MRVCALTWPFTFGVRLGWATARRPNPQPEEARGRVYLLRGNAIVFSGGFGAVCDRLREEGVWAEDLRCVGDRWVRKHLRADQEAGRLRGPVILVGHSCGGRYALFTAGQLARQGIAVELLICVDVALPPEVTSGVRCAVHLYRSRMRIYPARALRPAPGSPARVENVDLDSRDSPISPAWLHHMNMTGSPALQDWVVERIMRTIRTRESEEGQAGAINSSTARMPPRPSPG